MNIYDELPNQSSLKSEDGKLIEIDFSKNHTLLELIKQVKDKLPFNDELGMTLYFVCGKKCGENDYNEFFNYLATLPNPLTFVFRGYIHPDFVRLFFLRVNIPTLISVDSRLIYDPSKLYLLFRNMNGKSFQNFAKVLQEKYIHYDYPTLMDVTELESLGFNIEKF